MSIELEISTVFQKQADTAYQFMRKELTVITILWVKAFHAKK